jgi:hypothetical protein
VPILNLLGNQDQTAILDGEICCLDDEDGANSTLCFVTVVSLFSIVSISCGSTAKTFGSFHWSGVKNVCGD